MAKKKAAADLTNAVREAESMLADICVCGHTTGEHQPMRDGPCAADRHCDCRKFRRAPLRVVAE